MSQWYDDPELIAAKLTNLAGIEEVLTARREAGYEHGENLTELVLLGRLYLDQLGQMMAFERDLLPEEVQAQVPPVCTWEEFHRLVQEKGTPPQDGGWWRGWSSGSCALPTTTRRCPICGEGWDINNFWDVYVDQDFADLPLDEFVGKNIREVGDAITDRPEASYSLAVVDGKVTIRPAGVPPAESLYQEEGHMIRGPSLEEHAAWVAQHKEVSLDYIVQPEDIGGVIHPFQYQCYHGACYQKLWEKEAMAQRQAMQEDLIEMLKQVGFSRVSVKPASPPQTLLDQMQEEFDEGEDVSPEAVAQEMPYFAASTLEGTFGVMIAGEGFPMLDLSQTPFTLQDFGVPPEHCESGFRMIPIDRELHNLRLLRALLGGKRRKRKREKS